MTDLRWRLLLGATVIRKETWERIPADLRPTLLEAARARGAKLQADIREERRTDVDAMKKRGLNVVAVDAKTRDLWRTTAESTYPSVRRHVVAGRCVRRRAEVPRRVSQAEGGCQEVKLVGARSGTSRRACSSPRWPLITVIPLVDIIGRRSAASTCRAPPTYVEQLTLWLAFVGGLAAARQAKHLTLSTAEVIGEGVRGARAAARRPRWRPRSSPCSRTRARRSWSTRIEGKTLAIGVPEWVSEFDHAGRARPDRARARVGGVGAVAGRAGGVPRDRSRSASGWCPLAWRRACRPLARADRGRGAGRRAGVRRDGRHRAGAVLPRRARRSRRCRPRSTG